MFTQADMRELAKMERDMDSGIVKFVKYEGNRMPIKDDMLKEFGLVPGQTINKVILVEMLKFKLAECKAQQAIDKAMKASG